MLINKTEKRKEEEMRRHTYAWRRREEKELRREEKDRKGHLVFF